MKEHRTIDGLLPVTLCGPAVTLEPLSSAHHDALADAVRDGELWRRWYTTIPSPGGMRDEIARRLDLARAGTMLPFTVVHGDVVAGMTTYMNVDRAARRLEIGSTWYRQSVQRTLVNTEAKLLLLAHAFEALGCVAVEFRTSSFNRPSRSAIERLGAKLDGILRNHGVHANGTPRDTYVYSIIAAEWPAVKAHLLYQYERFGAPPPAQFGASKR